MNDPIERLLGWVPAGAPRCIDLRCGDGRGLEMIADLLFDRGLAADDVMDLLAGYDDRPEMVEATTIRLTGWATSRGGNTSRPRVSLLPEISALSHTQQPDLFEQFEVYGHKFDFAFAEVPHETESDYVRVLWGIVEDSGVAACTIRSVFFRLTTGAKLLRNQRSDVKLLHIEEFDALSLVVVSPDGEGLPLDAIRVDGDAEQVATLQTIESNPRLEHRLNDFPGEAFRAEPWTLYRFDEVPNSRRIATSDSVGRWFIEPHTIFWPYNDAGEAVYALPEEVIERLTPFRDRLDSRSMYGLEMSARGRRWFEFVSISQTRVAAAPAILFSRRGSGSAAVSLEPMPTTAGAMTLVVESEDDAFWIAGLINSSIGAFWMRHTFANPRGGYLHATGAQLRNFPIAESHRSDIATISRVLHQTSSALHSPVGEDVSDWMLTVRDAAARITNLQVELDRYAAQAYGVNVESSHPSIDIAQIQQSMLEKAMVQWVLDLISSGRLPFDRPFSVADVKTALSKNARATAIDSFLEQPLERILLNVSVPDVACSDSPKEGLLAASDVVGQASRYPQSTQAETRRRIFRLRGSYNIRSEKLLHMIGWSDVLRHPVFAKVGTDAPASIGEEVQFDLGRLAEMEAQLGETKSVSELLAYFGKNGWSLSDVTSCLGLLEEQGRIERIDDQIVPVN